MSVGRIHLDGGESYRPGEQVTGRVDGPQPSGEMRLFWSTRGRGTEELEVVATHAIGADGRFMFSLPLEPYSVAGSLVSIAWGIEWVDDQGDALDQCEIIVSPSGRLIELKRVAEPRTEKGKSRKWGSR